MILNEQALSEWIAYRKEIKKPLKPMTIDRVKKKLLKYDHETQEAMVEQSIENGWQGLFEVKNVIQPKQNTVINTADVDFIELHTSTDWSKDL
tara:strand:+ start:826 stop:1104 length:279 start_codon:yes stop_codon:yes gene_type:complete